MNNISNPFESQFAHNAPMPEAIYKRVTRKHGESIFMGKMLKDGTRIPILNAAYDEYRERTKSTKISFFERYAEGVLEGLKCTFTPFIDSLEAKKEMVLDEVNQDIYLFPTVACDDEEERNRYLSENMYFYGVKIGKLHKAWSIILQSPKIFLDGIIRYDKEVALKNKNLSGPTGTKLENAFKDPKYINSSLDILRQISPPAININNQYIGKSKRLFVVWYEELVKADLINPINDTAEQVLFLNNMFPGLGIARSTAYEFSKRAEAFRLDIKVLISKIPKIKTP